MAENAPGILGYCPKCGSDRVQKYGKEVGSGKQRFKCTACAARFNNPSETPDVDAKTEFMTSLPPSTRYVFTAAQNATPVHKPFLESLLHYCAHRDAELVVSGYRYRNPTSFWSDKQSHDEWWDTPLLPYLYQTREIINENLEFLGDVYSQATRVKPLTGFDALSGARSCILPHPKVQLRTVPTPAHQYPKILTTTGAVTVPNYTQTTMGKLGEFHHTFGAIVVEVGADGSFSMRQLSAQKNGAFFDMTPEGVIRVDRDGVTTGHKLSGLVMGDTHVDFVDPGVVAATFENDDSICRVGDPGWLVWHDLIDLYSRNRHADNPFVELAKTCDGTDSVYEELVRGWRFHDEMAGKTRSAIVNSNHTNARLDRFMQDCDWKKDPANAEFYLETALHMVRSLRKTESGHVYDDPFVHWGKKLSKAPNVTFLDLDKSFKIAGIECQYHGHIGPGAARGATLGNMRRIGSKSVFAHTHKPGTEEGTMTAGTSTLLRLGYNAGPSSWMNSHVGILPNGKRQHLFIMRGNWHY